MSDENNTIVNGDGSFTSDPGANGTANNSDTGTNVSADPILAEIDSVFGDIEGGDNSSNGGQNNKRQQSSTRTDGSVSNENLDTEFFGDKSNINKSNTGMPKDPEALIKRLQSEKDSTKAQLDKMMKELDQYKPVAEFVASLNDDENARRAFIAELEPDLVKPKDPLTFIKEGLKKDFGDTFTPDPDEANIFGSQTWLYNERAKDLLTEYKELGKKTPTSLKTLREQKAQMKQKATQEAMEEKNKTMAKFKWDDGVWDEFSKWASSLKLEHMGSIFERLRTKRSPNIPGIVGQSGGNSYTPAKFQQELNTFFG